MNSTNLANCAHLVRTASTFPQNQPEPYLGNGLMGYRIKPNPFLSWKAFASGYVIEDEDGRFERIAYAPYPFAMSLRLGDEPSTSERADEVEVSSQSLDMKTGELATRMTVPLGTGRAEVEVLQLMSRTCPVASCQEVTLTVPEDGTLEVDAMIVTGPGNTIYSTLRHGVEDLTDITVGYASTDDYSKCGVTLNVDFGDCDFAERMQQTLEPNPTARYLLNVRSGQKITIRTIAATVTSEYHAQPDTESCRMANWAASIGFDRLREDNACAWADIWKSRIKVTGDEAAQRYLDYCLFYTFSSAHPSLRTSIGPFGMSGLDYNCHVFWDTDTYLTPSLLLISPESAKPTMDYRRRLLESAVKKAQCYGYAGAMYPWESDIKGFESTPSGCATGWMEQHVNMCVAIAVWTYYKATGDEEFARESAWPILKAVAQWIESRVVHTERGCEIQHMTSSAECLTVNNSSYVNAISAQALRFACECADVVGYPPGKTWRKTAEKMYIPIGPAPEGTGVEGEVIYMHEDGFEEEASADSFMIGFPFDLPFDRELIRRTYEHCMKLDKQVLCMGHAFFTGDAAFVGDRAGARKLLDRIINETVEPVWGMGTEHTTATSTCFITTMGAMLQTAIMAFAGIRFEPKNWTKYEACLPEGWDRIEVDRIYLGGQAYRLEAVNGGKAVLTPIEED